MGVMAADVVERVAYVTTPQVLHSKLGRGGL